MTVALLKEIFRASQQEQHNFDRSVCDALLLSMISLQLLFTALQLPIFRFIIVVFIRQGLAGILYGLSRGRGAFIPGGWLTTQISGMTN